ncbi:S-adenosyl-L-methionine-dependent methyltransferase [Schizothecium vesticola]|uniref:Leucine carboxyl methyltransferase 1 n=1 Tax=Schizothecium vesticola TaxID=314040 RepID=A0AA40EQG9_9PEZI|nr:S-adenosyl-L-methionine-dependent methyltransferase [Schizothecium vesticola]
MSAPSIPNLLSLRGSGGRRGGRRGRGGHDSSASPSSPGQDATIQGTDTDAALSRLSAVEMGYLDDPFAWLFAPRPAPPVRRLPIINRGTYTRTTAIDAVVSHFLASTTTTPPTQRQIISLGAGTDTRALRLLASAQHPHLTYHELDFPLIASRKLLSLRGAPPALVSPVLTLPPHPSPGTTSWTATSPSTPTSTLHCHGLDLRALRPSDPLPPGVDPALPTLLISECCLCYLLPGDAWAAVAHFSSRVRDLGAVLYEPVRPDDSFGQMMVANLAARGIRMPTLDVFRTPGDQEERLRGVGFDEVRQMTVDAVWERWVGAEEKERVDGLEGLDEVEEWLLLAGHYIVVWGWRGRRMALPSG